MDWILLGQDAARQAGEWGPSLTNVIGGGGVVGANMFLIWYLISKYIPRLSDNHRKDVSSLVTDFRADIKQQHHDCAEEAKQARAEYAKMLEALRERFLERERELLRIAKGERDVLHKRLEEK